MKLEKNGLFLVATIEAIAPNPDLVASYYFGTLQFIISGNRVGIYNNSIGFIYQNDVSGLTDTNDVPFNVSTLQAFLATFESDIAPENTIYVNNLTNLPAPIGGDIILPNNGKLYEFTNMIDLQGNNLYVNNNVLRALSQELAGVQNGNVYLTQTATVERFKFDNCNIYFNALNGAFDWTKVNFYNCPLIDIQNADNIVFETIGFINTENVQISGQLNSLVISPNCIWRNVVNPTATFFAIKSTAIINRRVRIQDSVFATDFAGQTAISIESGAIIGVESFILKTIRVTGVGIAIVGLNGDDDRALFEQVNGGNLINSSVLGRIYMNNNITETPIVTQGLLTKVVGTFTANVNNQRFAFDAANNALEYLSSVPRLVTILLPFSVIPTSGNNRVIGTYIGIKKASNPAFNPTIDALTTSELYVTASNDRPQSSVIVDSVLLEEGDKIYLICENDSGTENLIYENASILIQKASI